MLIAPAGSASSQSAHGQRRAKACSRRKRARRTRPIVASGCYPRCGVPVVFQMGSVAARDSIKKRTPAKNRGLERHHRLLPARIAAPRRNRSSHGTTRQRVCAALSGTPSPGCRPQIALAPDGAVRAIFWRRSSEDQYQRSFYSATNDRGSISMVPPGDGCLVRMSLRQ
jgi:hypothetical protein